jgi:hypothetical protein
LRKESGSEGEATGGQDLAGARVGEEDDSGQVIGVPVVAKIEIDAERGDRRSLNGLEFAEAADDGSVLKRFAGVFASRDIGPEIGFGDGEPEFRVGGARERVRGIETEFKRAGVGIGWGDGSEEETRFGVRSSWANLFASVTRIAADELSAAIDDHLRSVDTAVGESSGVVLLATGEIGRRERVGPAEVIPVIDVLFESDDFGAVDGLVFGQFFEKGIGGRATGTAFGGEEFDDDGLPGSGIGELGMSGGVRRPAGREGNDGQGGG